MRKLLVLVSFLGALGMGTSAFAANADYEIETIHSHVLFNVSHLGFARMWGVFPDVTGTIGFDPDNIAGCKVDITIKTATIDTQFVDRNKDMRGADWFNVNEFPTMHFVSSACEKTGDRTGVVKGDLTLHGVTKPVSAQIILNKAGQNPMDKKTEVGFTATATIQREDFGMVTLGQKACGGCIGNDVNIIVEIEAKR